MRILGWAMMGVLVNMAMGQQPQTLTLKAKLRDFKEYSPGDATTHPDFENDAFMDCGGDNLGYVSTTIDTTDAVDTAVFHEDNRGPRLVSLVNRYSDKPCFTSKEDFKDWYNDNPAKNRSFYIDLTLRNNGNGVYNYDNQNFFPLDPDGGYQKFKPTDPDPFGPVPDLNLSNIFGFTLELHSTFAYIKGKNQVFSFSGDDDVWVYINGKLVIDLGGLHHSLNTTVNLDQKAAELGLVDGNNYKLDFFFAERHSTASHCQISTSLELAQKVPLPKPVATPPGQAFESPLQVSLSVPGVDDAQIHYTVDGQEPTEASPLYTSPIPIAASTTVKAKAFHPDYQPSPVLAEVYTYAPPPPPPPPPPPQPLPTPVANPPSMAFTPAVAVVLTVPGHPLAQIHYTLDGSEPTLASPVYTTPLVLSGTKNLRALALETGWLPSPIMSEVYTLLPPPNVIALDITRPVSHSTGTPLLPAFPDLTHPITVVSVDGPTKVCLVCPVGSEGLVLNDREYPEWKVSSREPFHYDFRLFDNLGSFVAAQSGEVTQAMLDATPSPDSLGYRIFRFRWIPVSGDGRSIGTGAYILHATVISHPAPGSGLPISTSSFFKTLGYVRQD